MGGLTYELQYLWNSTPSGSGKLPYLRCCYALLLLQHWHGTGRSYRCVITLWDHAADTANRVWVTALWGSTASTHTPTLSLVGFLETKEYPKKAGVGPDFCCHDRTNNRIYPGRQKIMSHHDPSS